MHNPPSLSVDDSPHDARAVSAPLTELHHELTEKEVCVLACAHARHRAALRIAARNACRVAASSPRALPGRVWRRPRDP